MQLVISIDAPPGTLRQLLTDLSKNQNILLLPTTTSETHVASLHDGLIHCLQNMLHRMSHISRCENAEHPLVCTHWYDIPLQVQDQEKAFVSRFMQRHTRSILMAYSLQSKIRHCPVILDMDIPYAFEILLEDMSAGSISSHDVQAYMTYIKTVAGPGVPIIPVSGRALDTAYIRQQLIDVIIRNTTKNGFPNYSTGAPSI